MCGADDSVKSYSLGIIFLLLINSVCCSVAKAEEAGAPAAKRSFKTWQVAGKSVDKQVAVVPEMDWRKQLGEKAKERNAAAQQAQKPQTSAPTQPAAQKPQVNAPTQPAAPKPQASVPAKPVVPKLQTNTPAKPAAPKPQTSAPTQPAAQKPQVNGPAKPAAPKPQVNTPAKPAAPTPKVVVPAKPAGAKSGAEKKQGTKKTAKNKQQKHKDDKKNTSNGNLNKSQQQRWEAYAKTGIKNITGDAVVREAAKYKGVRYVFGGTTPKGFDCSGYVQYVFKRLNANLTRTADTQAREGVFVTQRQLKVGDLVFFTTYEPGASHVGIYAGNGKFWNATSSRGIMLCSLHDSYWGPRYYGARRVLVANGEPK